MGYPQKRKVGSGEGRDTSREGRGAGAAYANLWSIEGDWRVLLGGRLCGGFIPK